MKKKKMWKRIMAGALSVTLVAGVFLGKTMNSTMDVQADTRVFSKIEEDYGPEKKVLSILEITTTDATYTVTPPGDAQVRNINQDAELGYFIPYSSKDAKGKTVGGYNGSGANDAPPYLGMISQGGKYGDPMTQDKDSYGDLLMKFRDYGLVKPLGADRGWQTRVGEYPLYNAAATFSSTKGQNGIGPDTFMKNIMTTGYYSYEGASDAPGYTGYILREGYVLDEKGTIGTIETVTVSDNTVSGNEPAQTQKVFVPVTDIVPDVNALTADAETGDYYYPQADLPKNAAGEYYIREATAEEIAAASQYQQQYAQYEQQANDFCHDYDFWNKSLDDCMPGFTEEQKNVVRSLLDGYDINDKNSWVNQKGKEVCDKIIEIYKSEVNPYTGSGKAEMVVFRPADEGSNYQLYFGNYLYRTGTSSGQFGRNSGWFAEYVLGSYKKYAQTELTYDVKLASSVTAADIENYDLIYISGTHEQISADAKNDISDAVMKALYEETTNHHKAIIMDFDGYSKSAVKGADKTNFSRLATLLWQEDQSSLLTAATETTDSKLYGFLSRATDETITLNLDKLTDAVLGELDNTNLANNESFIANTDGNFVQGNVYVYDHHRKDFTEAKSRVDAEDSFANGDFTSPYNATVVNRGFNNVLKYIQATNKNSLTGNMANEVTPAVVIQYILVSDGNPLAVMKNSLDILEIQSGPGYLYNPGRGSTDYGDLTKEIKDNRDDFIKTFLPDYFYTDNESAATQMQERITFTSMTINEFNGHNEDLIESYDVIYIGDEMKRNNSGEYTDNTEAQKYRGKTLFDVKKGKSKKWHADTKTYGGANGAAEDDDNLPYYVDKNMRGMIYYNIGDYHAGERDARFKGFLNSEPASGTDGIRLRFPGRDLTKDKLNKMKSFLDAGALIIVAEELYGGGVVNPTATGVSGDDQDKGRVDSSSNLYELLMYGKGAVWSSAKGEYVTNAEGSTVKARENLVSAADLRSDPKKKADISQYVALQKLDLLIAERPAEYGYTTKTDAGLTTVIDPASIVYMKNENSAGHRELKYVFSIGESDTLVSEIDTNKNAQYICKLFIDINNDGKYSQTTEDIADVRVVDPTGNEPARTAETNGTGHYLLYPGVQYTMTREIPDSYYGILKWRLSVEAKDKSTVHASEDGFTMVQKKEGKQVVKILQLTHPTASNLNLMWDLYQETYGAPDDESVANPAYDTNRHNKWGKYMVDVPDYKLEIRTVKANSFDTDFYNAYDKYNKAHPTETLTPGEFMRTQFLPNYVIKSNKIDGDGIDGKHKYTKYKNLTDEETVKGVNMLVLGFGDNYPNFSHPETVVAIRDFMEQGNPVLQTHDFITYLSSVSQVRLMRQVAGMDKYGSSQRLVKGIPAGGVLDASLTHYFATRYQNDGSTESTEGMNYLYTGVSYDRTKAEDKAKVEAIEGTNKEVAYIPGTTRKLTAPETQAHTPMIMDRWTQVASKAADASLVNRGWLSKIGAPEGFNGGNGNGEMFQRYRVEKLNEGQITHYPYILPDSFTTNATHSQYFQLDLTSDNDSDGESDVVVWYALGTAMDYFGKDILTGAGKNMYDDARGISLDPGDGYYIFNKGNITYTGAGHSDLENADDFEIQLFINTLLSTVEQSSVNPEASFYDRLDNKATPISSIVVPYDDAITSNSSVLKKAGNSNDYKYKFVDPNNAAANVADDDITVAYFRVNDQNLIRGTKKISVSYYLQTNAEENTTIKTNRGDERTVQTIDLKNGQQPVNVIDITDLIETHKIVNKSTIVKDGMARNGKNSNGKDCVNDVESSLPYAIFLPMDYLKDNASFTIYLEATTTVTSVTSSNIETTRKSDPVYTPLTVIKADLLDLD